MSIGSRVVRGLRFEYRNLESQIKALSIPSCCIDANLLFSAHMTPRFLSYYSRTRKMEGGWSNNQSDPGKATMFGLSSRSNPSLAQKIASKSLTLNEAMQYTYNHYFINIIGIEEIDPRLGFLVFDAKFHGMHEVISSMQKSMNEIAQLNLVIDGKWGRKTYTAALSLKGLEIDYVISKLTKHSVSLAEHAASRVLRYQQAHSLPTYDFTNGFVHRMKSRIQYAHGLTHV